MLISMHLLSLDKATAPAAPRGRGPRIVRATPRPSYTSRPRTAHYLDIRAHGTPTITSYDHDLGGMDTPVTRPTSRQHEPWGRSGESVS